MAGSNVISAKFVRPARGVTAQPASRPIIEAVSVPGEQGALGPGGSVGTVNGKAGNVILTSLDVGLGHVANLAPADLPVSDAQAQADAVVRSDAANDAMAKASAAQGAAIATAASDAAAKANAARDAAIASAATDASTKASAAQAAAISAAATDATSKANAAQAVAISAAATDATAKANARAAPGANSDITSLSGLTTPLSKAQGGLGNTTGTLSGAQTGSVFSDDATPARIHRLADRVLVGTAVVQDGKKFPVSATWVKSEANGYMTYFDSRSQFEVVSSFGATAVAAASRSSDMSPTDTGSIGFLSYVKNDYLVTTGAKRSAWGFYTHTVRSAPNANGDTAGGIQGGEIQVANLGAVVDNNPYGTGSSASGFSYGLILGSGGETGQSGISVNASTAALSITNGHGTHRKGIMFGANALDGTDGITGTANAIALAKGHEIGWYYSSSESTRALIIRSDATQMSYASKIIQTNTGLRIADQYENTIARFQPAQVSSAGSNNSLIFINATGGTGSPVVAAVGSSDGTVGIDFQGSGSARFGFYNQSKSRQIFRVSDAGNGTTSGNYIQTSAQNAGSAPSVQVLGVDTNIDLQLLSAGTGQVISKNATLRQGVGTTQTPVANGDIVVEATSNTSLTLKLKGSDGVVRSVVLTLS